MAKNDLFDKQILTPDFDKMMEKVRKFTKSRKLTWPPETFINDWNVVNDDMVKMPGCKLDE